MRNAFASEITELAANNSRIIMIMADIGNHLFDEFKARFPKRFFNSGIAEAHMISMAAGLASCGYRPICYTIAPFATTRCLEQIRVDVCYHNMPVVIVGTGSGLSYSSLGATHHSCEDIAMLRVLPNMKVMCPGDAMEVRGCLRTTLESESPHYIRIGKKNEPIIHSSIPDIQIGKINVIKSGERIALLNIGNTLPLVLEISNLLGQEGINAEVVSCVSIKPLDSDYLESAFREFDIIATIEEHSLLGGAGSSIAEWLADYRGSVNARLCRFGTSDEFFHICGNQNFARRHFKLTKEDIFTALKCEIMKTAAVL